MKFEEYKSKQLDRIVKDEYIKKFINDNSINQESIKDNFNVFNNCLESLDLCINCKGLTNCKQRKKGEYIGLVNNGFIDNNINYCSYYEKSKIDQDLIAAYIYSDIPSIYNTLSLDKVDTNDINIKTLLSYLVPLYKGTAKKGVYIYGGLGVGKTYMCIALSNSLVKLGKKVSFIKVNDFVTKMSQLMRDDPYEYNNILTKIKKCEYVILDDIGSEIVTESSRDRLLFNLLDYRMENKLITIFTSNLDKNSLAKHYGNAEESIKAKRLMERIEILSEDYCLKGNDRRRENND